MKRKNNYKAILSLFITLASVGICSCNKNKENSQSDEVKHIHQISPTWENDETTHYHLCKDCNEKFDVSNHTFKDSGKYKECEVCNYKIDFTDIENIKQWVDGLTYSINYTNDYTIHTINNYYDENDNTSLKEEYTISRAGYNFFYTQTAYEKDENNSLSMAECNTTIIKKVLDDNVERTKLYNETLDDDGNIIKTGTYVAPYYADYYEDFSLQNEIKETFENCSLDYQLFLESLKEAFTDENDGKEPDNISFTRGNDGSISLLIKMKNTYVSEDIEDEDYINSSYDDEIIYTVKEGKIISMKVTFISEDFYKDILKNEREKLIRSTLYDYKFASTQYEKFDITTSETTNEYYGTVSFVVENQNTIFYDNTCLVGKTYNVSDATNYLLNLPNFIVSADKYDYSLLDLYTDKEMTKPFTSMLMEDNITLYVKFNLPENKSAIITLFKLQNDSIRIQLVYIDTVGNTFQATSVFQDYKVLEIDGKEIKDNADTNILLESNKVHFVLYDAVNTIF